jgi:hypothetical protein
MKKILVVLLFVLLIPLIVWAQPAAWVRTSPMITVPSGVVSGSGYLYGVVCLTDGRGVIYADVYDNFPGQGGNKLMPTMITTPSYGMYGQFPPLFGMPPVRFIKGISIQISSSGFVAQTSSQTGCMVYYNQN